MDVNCPSGLSVATREFKVRDENLLANPKNQKRGNATTLLLAAVAPSLIDPGPYQIESELVPWDKILTGDRMVVLLQNRIETWGEIITLDEKCPKCRNLISNDFDLSILPIKALPEESMAHVTHGTPLTCTLPKIGAIIEYRLLRGADDRGMAKLRKQKQDSLSSAYLRYRTVSITSAAGDEIKPGLFDAFLADLGGSDASYLMGQFDASDCGVEQEVVWSCPEDFCDHSWRADIEFNSSFLFPKWKGKSAKIS